MSYGELVLPPKWTGRNKVTGRFLKGHVPANKGKKWKDFMSKRSQRRSAKGWKNLAIYRHRPDNAGRSQKRVVALKDGGSFTVFPSVSAAAEWLGCGNKYNIARCCRWNNQGQKNCDHRYMGFRWYFEESKVWTNKIRTY